ncbi:MAG: hypothetical protein EU521_00855 [Promethearchaeota archaeon]|nr:MAG: hypothetical protein EU521_00855 [Candidatus Lokiarchaeota archaeon]
MSSYDLQDISGIGNKTYQTLKNANIDTVEQLANSTVRELQKLDGIGKKSAEKYINGAKELLGRPVEKVVVRKSEVLPSKDSTIGGLQSDIRNIYSMLERFDKRIKNVENQLNISREVAESEISDAHFYRVLKSAYNSMSKKLGGFVPISKLTENIKQYIPWSTEKIHQKLYSLFMNYKVELQPGKAEYGKPLIQDDKKFVWFKFK